ncbi:hypothetical protein CTA2_2919 [Colletotrichum tanaceti]|uniref:Uncharacterized protein n=1 Tax=Colletotrichum tanaceti TaxID=1306861 RepID=A0A4U6XBY9_9PEZI|nr:hypothetical protein CTA2_2919 [Colletotrichum tanaceti]TKW52904.1 hypothetical protein CTA1_12079 [Colletotrichum tanaceti]
MCTYVFLWASLVFDVIDRFQSRKLSSIEKSLESLPSDLGQLYGGGLDKLRRPSRVAPASCWALSWLPSVHSNAMADLNIALSLGENTASTAALKHELEHGAEYTVKELGGFFLRIIDFTGSLVHQAK